MLTEWLFNCCVCVSVTCAGPGLGRWWMVIGECLNEDWWVVTNWVSWVLMLNMWWLHWLVGQFELKFEQTIEPTLRNVSALWPSAPCSAHTPLFSVTSAHRSAPAYLIFGPFLSVFRSRSLSARMLWYAHIYRSPIHLFTALAHWFADAPMQ